MSHLQQLKSWLTRKYKDHLWRTLMGDDDKAIVKSDRSDQLHEQHDVDSLSRMMLEQKEGYDRNLLEERLFSNKLKNWLDRYSRMKKDHRVMEDQLMQEAAILLGNPPKPKQTAGEGDPIEGEILDPPEEPPEAA